MCCFSEYAALTCLLLNQFPRQAVSLLANFTCLVECVLVHCNPSGKECCLLPLQGLSNLTKLVLKHGWFTDVDAARQLTSLRATNTTVKCAHDCTSVNTLVKLALYKSCLIGFHQKGVAACSRLQVLTLSSSIGYDDFLDVMFDLNQSVPQEPAGLSAMTALTRLQFTYINKHQRHFVWRLGWLTALANLQSVKAVVHNIGAVLPAVSRVLHLLAKTEKNIQHCTNPCSTCSMLVLAH